MRSAHELHIDLIRLLIATERLLSTGQPSADGSWEHWPRLCQFIASLDGLQSQLQARASEPVLSSRLRPTITAENLSDYDRRLENLRRTRDDLSSAAAAAVAQAGAVAAAEEAAAEDAEAAEAVTASTPTVSADAPATNSPDNNSVKKSARQREKKRPAAGVRGTHDARSASRRGASGAVFGGGGGGGQEADEAEADQVAQEISSMAGRLKESSMAINQTLRTQTQVLEDTGDAATQNVDRVRRENKRVAERLRNKRSAMFASWCMMLTVLVTFFATYALVIIPFEKRRGPFVRPRVPAFAHASGQAQLAPQQQQQVQHQIPGGDVQEELRKRSAEAYVEGARRARENQASANADLRLVAEERERARERQSKRMIQGARDRKEAAAAAAEAANAAAEAEAAEAAFQKAEEGDAGLNAQAVSGSQRQRQEGSTNRRNEGDQERGETVKIEVETAVQEQEGQDGTGVGQQAYDPAKAAKEAEEYRRKAQQAYEERSRLETERQLSANAGLRVVAEEKERYRQRHTEKILRKARERRAASVTDETTEAVEAELKARGVGGSAPHDSTSNVAGNGGEGCGGVGGGSIGQWQGGGGAGRDDEQEGVRAEGDGDSTGAVLDDAGVHLPPVDKEAEKRAEKEEEEEAVVLGHEKYSRETLEEQDAEIEIAGRRVMQEEEDEKRQRYRDNTGIKQELGSLDQEQAILPKTLETHAPRQISGVDSRPAEEEKAESIDAIRERLRENLAKRGRGGKRDEL